MAARVAVAVFLAALGGSFALPPFWNSCTLNFAGGARLPYPFCNASLAIEDRLADLVSRLTNEEKCAALDTDNPAIPRLGIPNLPGGEGLHGVVCGCGDTGGNSTGCPTSFPNPTALGATFDRNLYAAVGVAIGTEARALNNQNAGAGVYLFAPNVNMIRDPRWGRNQEVPSEAPVHTAAYVSGFSYGFQNGGDPKYMQAASTAKHFLVYDLEGYMPRTDPLPRPPSAVCDTPGGCERWNFDAYPPLRDLVGFYLPAFEAAVKVARVRSIMCSYNAVNGIPACANGNFSNALLRTEWGWDGMIVSDYTAVELMSDWLWENCQPPYPPAPGQCQPNPFPGGHNYTHTLGTNAAAALHQGGVDYNLGAFYKVWLYGALQNGSVSQEDVDVAVARVYRTHLLLGLLDPLEDQYYLSLPPSLVDSAEHRALALSAAEEAIVLLQNNASRTGQPLLPLKPTAKLAFIGPHANATQSMLSNYHGSNVLVDSHSPLQAALALGLDVTYARGCNICDVIPDGFPNMPCPPGKANDTSGFTEAAAVAKAADVAVVFVGSDQTTEAENFDRGDITLAGVQEPLIQHILAAQPNTVVVLMNGGSVSSVWVKDNVPAVLEAFYPGELGGDAIVNTLLGVNNPSGKMPMTTYHANFTGRDIRDVDLAAEGGVTFAWFNGPVLYPFGWGLSYTTFTYLWAAAPPTTLPVHQLVAAPLSYQVTVTNAGSVAGDAVVLAFVAFGVDGRGIAPDCPLKSLFDFTRVKGLQPGESRTVLFTAPASVFACVDSRTGDSAVHPGTVSVQIGDVMAPAEVKHTLTGASSVTVHTNNWARAVGLAT